MILHDWTTYFFAGVVVAGGLGVVYYWENFDIVHFEDPTEKQWNEPEIKSGAWRLGHLDMAIEPDTFVVFRVPRSGGQRVGRVVATAGQRVEIKDRVLLVDGQPQVIKGVNPRILASPFDLPEMLVPRGCFFVLNDQRQKAGSPDFDSRILGPIPCESVTHAFRPLGPNPKDGG